MTTPQDEIRCEDVIRLQDFDDDDDSVADKTYDPLNADDFPSSDSENEMISRAKRVKRQLFTPVKKSNTLNLEKNCKLMQSKKKKSIKKKESSKKKESTKKEEFNKKKESKVSSFTLEVKAVIENSPPIKPISIPVEIFPTNNSIIKYTGSIQESDDIIMTEKDFLAQNNENLQDWDKITLEDLGKMIIAHTLIYQT